MFTHQGPNYVHHVVFNAFVGNERFINDPTGVFKFMYKWDINKL